MKVTTRFAPSPTGLFHAGSYRTALFAHIYARQHDGTFILRIEDTDKERSKKEYEDNIIESLKWLGLDYDSLYRQSERTAIYKKYIQKLIDGGHAYISDESDATQADHSFFHETAKSPLTLNDASSVSRSGKKNDLPGSLSLSRRSSVIRFKNPKKKVAFDDIIRGRVEFDTTELGDFVIAKSLDEPIYHLVNVIDDYEMGVTHIIRGEEHISNTPRQILIFQALNVPPPIYAHIPLLLGADRSKLSKRKGAVPITDYRAKGYLPEALVNYMALLGWHPQDDTEVMTLAEITRQFSLERVQKGGAIFDEEKLRWFNRTYMDRLNSAAFIKLADNFVPEWLRPNSFLLEKLLPIIRTKISNFGEITGLFEKGSELEFVKATADYRPEQLLWKKNPSREEALKHLSHVRQVLSTLGNSSPGSPDDSWQVETIKNALWSYAEEKGKGDVLWPLRVALTGQEKSPDPFLSAFILGREESLKRIDRALESLKQP